MKRVNGVATASRGPEWRLAVARTLAWSLLLSGWIGLGSLVQTHASSVLAGYALMALWLIATGAFAEVLARLRLAGGVAHAALSSAGIAIALLLSSQGGGDAHLLALLLAWAAAIALGSTAVRAVRTSAMQRPAPPVASGAAAAALTWGVVGDLTDVNALRLRLAGLVLAACLGLVLLSAAGGRGAPSRVSCRVAAASGGCRANLFDCALPAWPASGGRSGLGQWPLMLAALVMLPMMCGLPLMLSLCRSESLAPHAILGLHLASMFLPAMAWAHRPLRLARAAPICASLLVLGAALSICVGGAGGGWYLVIAQGAAWSTAWAARLHECRHELQHERGPSRPSNAPRAAGRGPLAGAALNAGMLLTLGAAVESLGFTALADWHLALGAAATAWCVLWCAQTARRRRRLTLAARCR